VALSESSRACAWSRWLTRRRTRDLAAAVLTDPPPELEPEDGDAAPAEPWRPGGEGFRFVFVAVPVDRGDTEGDRVLTLTEGVGGLVKEIEGAGGLVKEIEGAGGLVTEIDGVGGLVTEIDGVGGLVTEIDGVGGLVTEIDGTVTETEVDGRYADTEAPDDPVPQARTDTTGRPTSAAAHASPIFVFLGEVILNS
jgi:hypothetical protein